MTTNKNAKTERPPVVAIMGHVDHGKSTLLDYIRKSNTVAEEAGGITQRVSAYEVEHKREDGNTEKITFIDTPGHAAFGKMRERGASIADIAILIVAADDGVNMQTKEAIQTIKDEGIPFVVAINKTDKPEANADRVKNQLMENEVFLEGYGGQISYAEISAKTGKGVDHLLEIILLLADLENFEGIEDTPATGFVLESSIDPKKGIGATLIIKNGTLKIGQIIASGNSVAKTRILENHSGKNIKSAALCAPVKVYSFDSLPKTGAEFLTFDTKKDFEKFTKEVGSMGEVKEIKGLTKAEKIIPVIVKSDTMGVTETILSILKERSTDSLSFKIIQAGTGNISENDVKTLSTEDDSLIIAFNVNVDPNAKKQLLEKNVRLESFDIIYKLTEFLDEYVEDLRPKKKVVEETGHLKVLKTFSRTKEKQVIGCRLEDGNVAVGNEAIVVRQEHEIGKGKIINLQSGKSEIKELGEPGECGIMIESKIELAPGDYIKAIKYVIK